MKVKSIAECSKWSILQYFWPALSNNWSWKPFFGLFVSGRFTQVLRIAIFWLKKWITCLEISFKNQVRIQRGGDRGSGPPPGKSQVIWVSIGNKQLDPPPLPWKKLDPPGKCWTPSGTLKNDRFLWNWPFDFCRISWGLKKKKKKKEKWQKFLSVSVHNCQLQKDNQWTVYRKKLRIRVWKVFETVCKQLRKEPFGCMFVC